MDGPKIIIAPMGGHGTVALIKQLQRFQFVTYRPDYPFTKELEPYDLDSKPEKGFKFLHQGIRVSREMILDTEWYLRTRLRLNYNATIRSNLMAAFHKAPGKTILFGKCSLNESFLTNEEINALCFVRHPLAAFDSFFARRHPQWVWHKDGLEAPEFIEWYCKMWMKIVDDFAASGNPILRYETLVRDTKFNGWTELSKFLEGFWRPSTQVASVGEDTAKMMYDILHNEYTHWLYDPCTWLNYTK